MELLSAFTSEHPRKTIHLNFVIKTNYPVVALEIFLGYQQSNFNVCFELIDWEGYSYPEHLYKLEIVESIIKNALNTQNERISQC